MKKRKKRFPIGKWIVGITGMLFVLYGIFLTSLWLIGTPKQAKITSYRMESGERDETIRNSYTFVYAYEFSVNGKTFSGNSRDIKSPIHVKNSGYSTLKIHYLGCCPFLNCPVSDFSPKYKLLLYFGLGMLFLYFLKKMR